MSIERFYEIHATVQQWTVTSTELGINVFASTYTTLTNVDGAIELLSKNEMYIEGTDRVVGTHRFYTDINDSISEEQRIVIGNDIYEIRSVENPMQLDHHLEIIMELAE